jgi:hypothetical protein
MVPLLAVAAALTILVLPTAAAAQSGPVLPPVIESLRDSQWVRLATSDLGRRQGRLLEPGASDLVLATGGEPLRVPATSVDTLWTKGTSWKQGAVVGAILGLGLGVAAAAAGFGEEDVDQTALWVGCMGIGTAGGALVGTIFGAAIPRWKRRYP